MLSRKDESSLQSESSHLGDITLPGGTEQLKYDGTGSVFNDCSVLVSPTTGFVVKTRHQNTKVKVFINVCSSDLISAPNQTKKLDKNGNEVEGINVPLSVGPVRVCCDKAGKPSEVVDCIVSPEVIEKTSSDGSGSYRDFICKFLIQCVERKFKNLAHLDKKYKLPHLAYHGYTHSITGEVVDKGSKYAEAAKQAVRDQRKRPKIQEIDPLKHKAAPGKEKSYRTLAPSETTFNIDIGVEVSDGTVVPLLTYINEVNKLVTTDNYFRIQPLLLENMHKCCSYSQLLDQPLLCDSIIPELSLKNQGLYEWAVTKIHASVKIAPSIVLKARVDLSAYMLTISAPRHNQTDCILPFCVLPNTAKCTYSQDTSYLHLDISVSQTKMDDAADVGSRPWTFAKGLNRGQHILPEEKKVGTATGKGDQSINKQKGSASLVFQLEAQNGTARECPVVTEDTILPEDKFHDQDIMSQHLLEQQVKEKEGKNKNIKAMKENVESNDDVECISFDDFKPGGQYFPAGVDDFKEKQGNKEMKTEKGFIAAKHVSNTEDIIRNRSPELSSTLWSTLV